MAKAKLNLLQGPLGRKQLARDAAYWQRRSAVMGRVLGSQTEGGGQ